jgi:acyl-CoA dehydrogenase
MRQAARELAGSTDTQVVSVGAALAAGVEALDAATAWMLHALATQPDAALGSSVDYLMLTGYVCGGWQMGRAALAASRKSAANEDPDFHRAKLATACFYTDKVLPKANALLETIRSGASSGSSLPIELF